MIIVSLLLVIAALAFGYVVISAMPEPSAKKEDRLPSAAVVAASERTVEAISRLFREKRVQPRTI
jgi:hypothetical protein